MATTPEPGEPPRAQQEASRSVKRPVAIVDFGKAQSRRRIKRLRKGKGKLVPRVENIVDELLASPELLKMDETPVIVIVVREKSGNRISGFSLPFG